MDISNKPEMETMELLNHTFSVPIRIHSLEYLQELIHPNLPWADDHFQERVSGYPLNPGYHWQTWPYGKSAAQFKTDIFSHSYAERYWPKFARDTPPTITPDLDYLTELAELASPLDGIRFAAGDLQDVVNLLKREPMTRQAYLPVWFPEDTGVVHGERVPCSLGYHFIRRGHHIHIIYYLRSCDFVRHFRDDIYLTARLLFWVLEQLQKDDPENWKNVMPGTLTMHITSLHCFKNDVAILSGKSKS
jgi:hypothetical protein